MLAGIIRSRPVFVGSEVTGMLNRTGRSAGEADPDGDDHAARCVPVVEPEPLLDDGRLESPITVAGTLPSDHA